MQSGFIKKPMTIEDIAMLYDIEAPKKRGNYKQRIDNIALIGYK